MKIEKLNQNSYRVRKTLNKKVYTVVFDHKPTELEAMLALSDKIEVVNQSKHIPFEVAAKEYVKLKANVLSPTTYREYSKTCDRLSKRFCSLYVDDITPVDVQQEINELSAKRKPKTVRNYHGFISAVLGMYRPNLKLTTTLPKEGEAIIALPTDEQLKLLIEHSKTFSDGMYYVPVMLGCYGLSRSEICALELSDFEDNIVFITKAKVMDVNNKWIIKEMSKTEKRTRQIPLPESLVEYIRNQGYVYNGHPGSITGYLTKACKYLKIEHFSLHKLRHYFCSRLSSEKIDTETILSLGGWKTDHVMKKRYRHAVSEKVQDASDRLTSILSL